MKAMRLSLRTCPIFVEGFLGDSCINGRRPLEICKASFRTEVVKGFNGINKLFLVHGHSAVILP